ncbi:hypothetical protein HY772_01315 [Candidatus Woesearchaeota archaeon]|nr:hypothetical protein [Candidatus Woesearchaeota archaeon]
MSIFKNSLYVVVAGIVLFVAIFAGSSAGGIVESLRVQKIDYCANTSWLENQTLYGNCTNERVWQVCDDAPLNLSCQWFSENYTRTCTVGYKTVAKMDSVCHTTDVIADKIKFAVENYGCSTQEDGTNVIVVCDSKYDGNGDGVCQSGESCLKYVVNGNTYEKFEKNSRDDFVASDKSFFVEEASAEVLQ